VIDLNKVEKLRSKEYRDAYIATLARATIAYQIRELREQAGLTQSELAAILGKPQSVVSRLENTHYGKMTVQTLLDLASAFDVALDVRFCSFRDFLDRNTDKSSVALRVPSFDQIDWRQIGREQPKPADAATVARAAPFGLRIFEPFTTYLGDDLWTTNPLSKATKAHKVQDLQNTGIFMPIHVELDSPPSISASYSTTSNMVQSEMLSPKNRPASRSHRSSSRRSPSYAPT
jgi:transcriptional regulator with XRE-family HTH domain